MASRCTSYAGFCRRLLPSHPCLSSNPTRTHRPAIYGTTHHENARHKHTSRCARHHKRSFSSAPFYGEPAPPSSRYNQNTSSHIPPLSPLQRITTLIHSSITALNDPTRADAVAAVGEVTGSYALANMRNQMQNDAVGKRILQERPVVDEQIAKRAFELLNRHNQQIGNTSDATSNNPITFAAAYATFLQTHNFDPEERSPIRFIPNPELAYVMTRYRQCHDYFHVLTGLPPTVLGELALKWLELMQTGLPLAALSATGGSLRLDEKEREILWNVYFPWAVRVGREMRSGGLMCVYYEEEMETDLEVLRGRIGVEPAPFVDGV
ncbi:hypothetical protein ACHAWO_001795 [Cyclotella atomus]|uniref:Ubiquinone biosynthesis protein COQ4 homolog, mitochondrial n=1 Tax=Cyclotella atomus TaxID=382360 RepID=A0ABD3MVB4_9STRA